jgi:nucleotide-binding universal stress UspA family protein
MDTKKAEEARRRLEVATEAPPAGVDVAVEIEAGRPSEIILRTAKRYQADLIILGMPIQSFLQEKFFGSTAMAVCHHSTIPVMVLRPQLISTFTAEELNLRCQHLFRELLVPYDGSERAKYLVETVKKHYQSCPSRSLELCYLCWVVEDVGRRDLPPEYFTEPAHKALATVKADLEGAGLTTEVKVLQGDAIVEVLEFAQMADVSAIATTSHSLGKLQELSIPSFTRELLHRSWHPIIYFPA